MKTNDLEAYLEEIGHYLPVSEENRDILAEIRSHILEKAESRFGDISPENVRRVIAAFGTPRRVAVRYAEEKILISPIFSRYIIRYTFMLFLLHSLLIIVAAATGRNLYILPFFFIPAARFPEFLMIFPSVLIFDIGLVGLFFTFLTRKQADFGLPWPRIGTDWLKKATSRQRAAKWIWLALMTAGYACLVVLFLKHKTLFFLSLLPGAGRSLMKPEPSLWYSAALLALLGIGVAGYASRLRWKGAGPEVVKNGLLLAVYGAVLNFPFDHPFIKIIPRYLETIGLIVIISLTLITAYSFVKSLVVLAHQARSRKSKEREDLAEGP